jgi:hypothetical protein
MIRCDKWSPEPEYLEYGCSREYRCVLELGHEEEHIFEGEPEQGEGVAWIRSLLVALESAKDEIADTEHVYEENKLLNQQNFALKQKLLELQGKPFIKTEQPDQKTQA